MLNKQHQFGFGTMRLPQKDGHVDREEMKVMVDHFLEQGFRYFDTAHGYCKGESEPALRECLTSRYPRESYLLADKLSRQFFNSPEEVRPLFEKQLEILGVDYFDFYLMHTQNASVFAKFKRCRAYETVLQLKEEGRIRHFGISFHDKAEVLEQILTEYPQIEVVQLQFNYLDLDSPEVESGKCYDVCVRHGKRVIVMEPVRGGRLARLPEAAARIYDALGSAGYASYALRFLKDFDNIMLILSGMSDRQQMRDNCEVMKQLTPLNAAEREAVARVTAILKDSRSILCTACNYCTERCPMGIRIPSIFASYNDLTERADWRATICYVDSLLKAPGGDPAACIKCGLCEEMCPQKLPVRSLLEQAGEALKALPGA